MTLRSSRVGSTPTKYPYPKAFYPGIRCRGAWGRPPEYHRLGPLHIRLAFTVLAIQRPVKNP
eukprot:scaffold56361_cov71-Cyclotella_meneghiniana.AAC.3